MHDKLTKLSSFVETKEVLAMRHESLVVLSRFLLPPVLQLQAATAVFFFPSLHVSPSLLTVAVVTAIRKKLCDIVRWPQRHGRVDVTTAAAILLGAISSKVLFNKR